MQAPSPIVGLQNQCELAETAYVADYLGRVAPKSPSSPFRGRS
jgi:hypothetical protein